jgi:hypothetical protein
MAADRPAAQPLDTMKVRGRLRGVWLALWLAGAAGCIAVGVHGDTPEDTLGSHQLFLSLFLFLAALSVVVAVRGFGRGLDADGNGVVVRNMLRATSIAWRELAAIEFKGVDSEAIRDMYYQLVFQREDGSRVTAETPGGGARPGEYIFELRERLLAMRSAALGDRHAPADRPSDAASTDASNPTTRTDTPRATATWPLLDTPPTTATVPVRDASSPTRPTDTPPTTATWPLLEEPALPPAATESRRERWGVPALGVAVAVAIALLTQFGPDLLLLLGDDDTADPDPPAVTADGQRVYWQDLQPGMCIREDPNGMDYPVVDCSAEHEEEVMSRDTLARSKEYPGDAAVDDAAQKKCETAFAAYVGLELDESRLDLDFLTPDKDSWTAGKVTLICLVLDPDHDQITRALRGAHE